MVGAVSTLETEWIEPSNSMICRLELLRTGIAGAASDLSDLKDDERQLGESLMQKMVVGIDCDCLPSMAMLKDFVWDAILEIVSTIADFDGRNRDYTRAIRVMFWYCNYSYIVFLFRDESE